MELFIYKDRILATYKDEELDVQPILDEALSQNRKQLIDELEIFVPQMNPKPRANLMGLLMEDGGVDLIPAFITAIEKEPNVLYAKSLLNLYGKFEHFEAVEPLKAIKSTLNYQLDKTHQRILSKLNGKFREHFYMGEFEAGNKSYKRMKHAMDVMLESNDPVYVPFVSAMILSEDPVYREPGVRVLDQLGDETCVDPLLELLEMVLKEKQRNGVLQSFLFREDMLNCKSLQTYLQTMGEIAGWEEDRYDRLSNEILSKRYTGTITLIAHSFGPFANVLWEQVTTFLKDWFSRGEWDKDILKRMEMAFTSDLESKNRLINNLTMALGKIGRRDDLPDVATRVEAALPEDEPKRASFVISMLAGYRSPKALKDLYRYLEEGDDPEILSETLVALDAFEMDSLHPKLFELAVDPDFKAIRNNALNLIGRTGPKQEELAPMLDCKLLAVRNDVVSMIANFGLEAGYQLLLEHLARDASQAFNTTLLEALEAFPRKATGEAVARFYYPNNPYPVRSAALNTLAKSGGHNRMTLIFKGLDAYDEKKVPEEMTSIFMLIEPLPPEKLPADIVELPERWAKLMVSDNEKFRTNTLNILEKADWDFATNHDAWVETLTEVLETKLDRHIEEQRRVKGLLLKARSRQIMKPSATTNRRRRNVDKLYTCLDRMESGSDAERLKALYVVNVVYRTGMLSEKDCDQLVYLLQLFFAENQKEPANLKLAISISAKMGHPKLETELKHLLQHWDHEVQRFARAGLRYIRKHHGSIPYFVQSVLVMDQTPYMSRVVENLLEKTGYLVALAPNAKDCIQMLTEEPYDLLILGEQVPEGLGVNLWRKTKRLHVAPDRIIILTAQRGREQQAPIKASGVDGLLAKPFSSEELIEMIKSMSHEQPIEEEEEELV